MPSSAVFEPVPRTDEAITTICDWFGLPDEAFEAHAFWRRQGSSSLWVASAPLRPPPPPALEVLGLRVLRSPHPPLRVGNGFVRRFGHLATRHVVPLDGAQAARFVDGEHLTLHAERAGRGYRIVLGPDGPLGRGRMQDRELICELSKVTRRGTL